MLLPLKYKMDRYSLEKMFTAFVSSTMYYGVEVWGGSYDSHLLKLEQLIVDGMRLVTGATARSNISKLFRETCWSSFGEKRDEAMLIMMFKVKNNLAPNYLTELLPPENRDQNRYNLRNSNNVKIPLHRGETIIRSFIPTAIKLWNRLELDTRNSKTLTTFKTKLKSDRSIPNVNFYYGQRWPSILHSRLRIGCSSLTNKENETILDFIHEYIIESNRFN